MTTTRLEPLTRSHAEGIQELVSDPAVLRFTRVPVPTPPDFVDTWFARYEAGRRDGTREAFAIVDADGAFLGIAVAPEIDAAARTAELGYVLAPHARGRGVASAALQQLTDWALDELGMLRLELLIAVANEASQGVARRCGYTLEGVLRSHHLKEGVREDTQIWSLLPGER